MLNPISCRQRFPLSVLTAALLFNVVGCDSHATVNGKITYKGRTVTHGSVVILASDNSAHSGAIYADGSFTVEGVSPGEAKIGVISHDPSKGRSILPHEKHVRQKRKKGMPIVKTVTKDWFPLPHNLEDPSTSGLVCTLQAGAVQHNLELK